MSASDDLLLRALSANARMNEMASTDPEEFERLVVEGGTRFVMEESASAPGTGEAGLPAWGVLCPCRRGQHVFGRNYFNEYVLAYGEFPKCPNERYYELVDQEHERCWCGKLAHEHWDAGGRSVGGHLYAPAPTVSEEAEERGQDGHAHVWGSHGCYLCGAPAPAPSEETALDEAMSRLESTIRRESGAEETAGLDELWDVYGDRLDQAALRAEIEALIRAPLQAQLDEVKLNLEGWASEGAHWKTRAEAAEAKRDQMAEALREARLDLEWIAASVKEMGDPREWSTATQNRQSGVLAMIYAGAAQGVQKAERALAATSQGGEGKGE